MISLNVLDFHILTETMFRLFKSFIHLQRCGEICDQWANLLGDLVVQMKESGNNDLGFANATCSYENKLCRGMRFLCKMKFL